MAGDRLMTVADALGMDGARDLVIATLLRLLDAWSDGGTAVDQEDASLVAVGLHDKRTRDEVMTFVLDHDGPLLVAVFSEIARRAVDEDTAPICTVLAWAAYADGAVRSRRSRPSVRWGASRATRWPSSSSTGWPGWCRRTRSARSARQVRADLEGGGCGAALGSAG